MFERLKTRAKHLKSETFALYLAVRHPDTPWYAKLLVAAVVAYAFSPIDLIPDFVPILGYVDDLILIPLGIFLALKLIPPAVMSECRLRAQDMMTSTRPIGRIAGAVIIGIWIILIALGTMWVYEVFASDSPFPRT